MKTSSRMKKFNIVAAALLVVTTSLVAIPHSFAGDVATVRLVSPVITSTNSIDRTSGDLQIPAQKWYREGSKSLVITSEEGKELTLKFLLTKDGSTPWAGQVLKLYVGAPYSGSTGSWEANGMVFGAQEGTWSSKPAGEVSATTGSDGIATYTFTNKNSGVKLTAAEILAGVTNPDRKFTQFKPWIVGLEDYTEPYLIKDIISVDIVKEPAAVTTTPAPTTTPAELPSMRLVSPEFGSTNSVDDTNADIKKYYSAKTSAFYTYIAAGTTLTLKYLVTSDGKTPMANQDVTLQVNSPYSGSKANWLFGSTKITAPASDTASGYDLKGTTNAKGEVTFIIKNTDTTGTEAKPATPTAPAPKVRLYGTFKAIINGYGDKEADVDLVTFDVYAAPKPVVKATTITCIKGKLAPRKVTAVNPKCPTGYKKK